MSASTDKVHPRSLRSGLSELGSGGWRFESHLCFTYLKEKVKSFVRYECNQVISVCVHGCGSSGGWSK